MKDVEYQGLMPVVAIVAPARAAYLVRAGSRDGFRRAVQEACTRWGGATEPILPVGDDGQLEDWVNDVASISGVDGLVNIDLTEDEAQAASSQLGLPCVPIAHIDRYGTTSMSCHPSWVDAPVHPTLWAASRPSGELWQAVAAGELSDEHLASMPDLGPGLSMTETADGIGRAQLRGSTWLDRTMVSLDGTYASPGPFSAPTILWVTTGDDLEDSWHFWNTRALGPRTFARMPIILLPFEDVLYWESFDKQLLASLERPNEFSIDVIITSRSTPEAKLHELAQGLQLQLSEDTDIKGSMRFPVTTERRKAPYSYCVNFRLSRYTNFDRRYGVVSRGDAHFFTGRPSSVTFDSPVAFNTAGTTLIRLESQMFDGLPRRQQVASLIAPDARWRDNSLQVGVYTNDKYRLELNVPRLPEVLKSLLRDKVSYSMSDKGSLAAAFHRREGEVQALLEPDLFETIRAMTTPRSKSLIRELTQIIGEGELTPQIMEVAQGWAVQGKRTYKNVSGISGLRGAVAATALERLCELGWAERGLEIKCTTCHSSSFLELDSVLTKSGATCPACDDTQRYTGTGTGPTVFYRLDGLVDRASDQGVFPHLLTIAALTQREAHSYFLPGVDVVFEDGSKNEADVIGLYGGRYVVGEVKTSASEFTAQQLEKDVGVARRLNADVYLMAATDQISDETRRLAEGLCKEAQLELIVLEQSDLRPSEPGS
ncbi:hypothetical protein PV761_06135 [Arthrobacter sp. CC3]|uniref:hypothetical protein n=1 Tax=Arthrobacter sp. CC3 TaxID=3029185 RepID=UPI003263FE6E